MKNIKKSQYYKVKLENGKTLKIKNPRRPNFLSLYSKYRKLNIPNDEKFISLVVSYNEFNKDQKILVINNLIILASHILFQLGIESYEIADLDAFFDELDLYITNYARSITDAFSSINSSVVENIATSLELLRKSLEQFKPLIEDTTKAQLEAIEYFWVIGYDLIDYSGPLSDVLHPKISIDNILLEFYSNKIIKHKMDVLRHSPLVSDRVEIINQLENGFIRGYYYLVIPILFAQIESLLVKIFGHDGQLYGMKRAKLINKVFEDPTQEVNARLKEFLLSKIYGNFGHGEKIDFILNRNAILHGGDIEYGKRINAVKLFLVLAYLVECGEKYKAE